MQVASASRRALALVLCLALAGCGGGGGAPTSVTPTPTPTTVTPTPSTTCSLRSRQDWAAGQLRTYYLFPETLPASLDPAPYTSVQAYIDALTATARSQNRDRFFTYVTSIAEENAFFASGSTAAFGIRLQTDGVARRVFVADAYEGAPALAAGLDRGTEILAIGTSTADLRDVSAIIAAEGTGGITNALGPSTAGITRTLRITDSAGPRVVSVTKADFAIPPVSSRFGTRILDNGGTRVGYVNLRTFISTADPALRAAFADFRAQGITQLIIDFRYNGGGLVSIAELMGDLLGDNRSSSDVFSYTTFRTELASNNSTKFFSRQPQSLAPTKIAFIGTSASASASELVMNSMVPYLRANGALIGSNTFGKPVGQIARDQAACDDRLRVVAFATQNSERRGNYYTGMASEIGASCSAADDINRPMGDPAEASTRAALDFLAGRSCSAIAAEGRSLALGANGARTLLVPERVDTVQREVPGTY
ncbi:MAG: peptidase S41 [Alphaproteobacteria bacterium PA4]|nr:MAG: peptidase S41 [Alphaproteobacteria bacterium PA4]